MTSIETNNYLRKLIPGLRGFSIWDIAVALALGAAMGWATRGAWIDLANIAINDEEASHVLLVPVVALWTFFVRRGRLRQCRPSGRLWPLVGLGLGYASWLYGFAGQHQSFYHAGAIVLTVSAVLVGIGTEVVWRFIPVFGALVFLIPVPSSIRLQFAIPMQEMTARVTQQVCEVVGMNVARTGNLLSINGTDVTVAEACNGMRMVFTLLMVCYAFTFTEPLRTSVRATILLASPVVAVIANVMRLVPTVWAFGEFSKPVAEKIHDAGGWAMLVAAFLFLSGIVRILRWAMMPVSRFNIALS